MGGYCQRLNARRGVLYLPTYQVHITIKKGRFNARSPLTAKAHFIPDRPNSSKLFTTGGRPRSSQNLTTGAFSALRGLVSYVRLQPVCASWLVVVWAYFVLWPWKHSSFNGDHSIKLPLGRSVRALPTGTLPDRLGGRSSTQSLKLMRY